MSFTETIKIIFAQGNTGLILIGLFLFGIIAIIVGSIEIYKGSHYL